MILICQSLVFLPVHNPHSPSMENHQPKKGNHFRGKYFLVASLRYYLHTIKFTHCKCIHFKDFQQIYAVVESSQYIFEVFCHPHKFTHAYLKASFHSHPSPRNILLSSLRDVHFKEILLVFFFFWSGLFHLTQYF